MKNIKIQTLLFLSIHCSLRAVKVPLPYPSALKKSFGNGQELSILVRSSKDDIKTVSSECPLSKVSFDELFNDAATNKIVIGGIITEVNNTLVTHHFDGAVLMDYVINLLPEKTTLLKFMYSVSHEYTFKNAYKHAIDTTDTRVLVLNAFAMTDNDKEWYKPIFINPINRQKILTLHFFTLHRSIFEDGRYEYEVCSMGDMNELSLHESTAVHFEKCLLKNMFWQDKLDLYKLALSIKKMEPLSQSNYRAREKAYAALKNIFDVKKDEIKEDPRLYDDIHSRLRLAAELFADFFDTSHNYVKALEYYEKELRLWPTSALLRAATIRLGYMKQALPEEQLKGLVLYEKILESCKNTHDSAHYAFELAQLLYERAQTYEDYAQAGSYIKKFVEDHSFDWEIVYYDLRKDSHVLMAKIYFGQGDYDSAKHYLKRLDSLKGKDATIEHMLLAIEWAQDARSVGSLIRKYKRLDKSETMSWDFELRGYIAQNLAYLLWKQFEQAGFRKKSVSEVEDFLQRSKTHYTEYLERHSSLNDYKKDSIRSNIQEVDAKLLLLLGVKQNITIETMTHKHMQELEKKDAIVKKLKKAIERKRTLDTQVDKQFKRKKE
jgi:tetratricopeptide (TPR) repeat protein